MKKKKTIVLILSIISILSILVIGIWFYYNHSIHIPVNDNITVESFMIEEGELPSSVGMRLEDLGLIRSAQVFSLYLKLNPDLASGIQAGEYEVTGNESIVEMIDMFQNGATLVELRFIEGWRREEMAIYLESLFDREFAESFLLETQELEGYLFPDTYYVGVDVSPSALADLMQRTYAEKTEELLTSSQLTKEQVAIFASILEREIARQDDRRIVAGILIKRWQNGWPIGADATVQFAWASATCHQLDKSCVWWQHVITQEMLEIESSYNTRKYVGLPPDPIASSGIDSIQAVVNPVDSEYWYYLSDSEGNTHYGRTLEEHNSNIVTYLY